MIKRYKPVNHGDYFPPTMEEDKVGEYLSNHEVLAWIQDKLKSNYSNEVLNQLIEELK